MSSMGGRRPCGGTSSICVIAFMRMMIKNILTQNGHEVVGEAENGQQAVDKFKELTPDVCTMDITMPEKDGIAALKEIMAARLGLPSEQLVPEARLQEDLGLDSLDAVELAIAVERKFNIDVPEEELTKLKTVADMLALVESRMGRAPE